MRSACAFGILATFIWLAVLATAACSAPYQTGEITGVSPTTLEGGTASPVTVYGKHTCTSGENEHFYVRATGIPAGWTVTPNPTSSYEIPPQGTYGFAFTITPPAGATGESITFELWQNPAWPDSDVLRDSHVQSFAVTAADAPSLQWTGEAGYTSDGLEPESGTTSTTFRYRIIFADSLFHGPMSGYPKVHIKQGGVEIAGSPFTMTAMGSGIYSFDKTLAAGTNYSYYFEAKCSAGVAAPNTPELDAPDVTAADVPSLQWTGEAGYTSDGLEPESGTTSTTFRYRIIFADSLFHGPMSGYPKVHIKQGGVEIAGSPFTMTAMGSGIYSFDKTLTAGTNYSYYFEAKCSAGVAAPNTPELDAPDVTANPPPSYQCYQGLFHAHSRISDGGSIRGIR